MPKINVLPKEVYQLIAAGEVVERPSSVVKEMVENSIDAGASNITVEIKNGGTTYIRVTDNGCGIEKSEIKKVFIPHATSKIHDKNDLNAVYTLGFRGEAMASIAAVARVELLTKSKDESIGTKYTISAGEEEECIDAGCPDGTTIVVRDIFYNTPARMKFLKKDVTEGNAVAGIVDKMALSHPQISFRFIRDGKQTLITSGNGDLLSAIYSVFGREFAGAMIPVDYSYENMSVQGYVSKPVSSRKSRAMQFFFINSRFVKSRTAMAALEQAYKNSIMVGRFPMCVLNISVNPVSVDVNVHPAKIEVRFSDERPVFDLIYYGVKSAIESDRSVKQAEFSPQSGKDFNFGVNSYHAKIDFFKKNDDTPVQQKIKPVQNNDFWQVRSPQLDFSSGADKSAVDTDDTYECASSVKPEKVLDNNDNIDKKTDDETEASVATVDDDKDINFRLIGEAFKTYLIAQIDNDLYFIDKHAAHERMNYEKFISQSETESQMLLTPAVVNLSKDEFGVIMSNAELLQKCGFETEPFGESAVIVRAVPSLTVGCDVPDLIEEIAEKLLEHKTDITPDKIDWIYHSASCRAAVKAGDTTSPQEQEMFLKKLFSMPNIRFCPHGRPVFIKISKYDIEKQFGRA